MPGRHHPWFWLLLLAGFATLAALPAAPAETFTMTVEPEVLTPGTAMDVTVTIRNATGGMAGIEVTAREDLGNAVYGTATTNATGVALFRGLKAEEGRVVFEAHVDGELLQRRIEARPPSLLDKILSALSFGIIPPSVCYGLCAMLPALTVFVVWGAHTAKYRRKFEEAKIRGFADETTDTAYEGSRFAHVEGEGAYLRWKENVAKATEAKEFLPPSFVNAMRLKGTRTLYLARLWGRAQLESQRAEEKILTLGEAVTVQPNPTPRRPTTFLAEEQWYAVAQQIRTCEKCNGKGRWRCGPCGGRGSWQCTSCNGGRSSCGTCGGSGRVKMTDSHGRQYYDRTIDSSGNRGLRFSEAPCGSCAGMGWATCSSCGGKVRVTCKHCNATGEQTCKTCATYGKVNDVSYQVWKYTVPEIKEEFGAPGFKADEKRLERILDRGTKFEAAAVDSPAMRKIEAPGEGKAAIDETLDRAAKRYEEWVKGQPNPLFHDHTARLIPATACEVSYPDGRQRKTFTLWAAGHPGAWLLSAPETPTRLSRKMKGIHTAYGAGVAVALALGILWIFKLLPF